MQRKGQKIDFQWLWREKYFNIVKFSECENHAIPLLFAEAIFKQNPRSLTSSSSRCTQLKAEVKTLHYPTMLADCNKQLTWFFLPLCHLLPSDRNWNFQQSLHQNTGILSYQLGEKKLQLLDTSESIFNIYIYWND